MRLRLKLLACKVLYREISMLTYRCKNIVDVTYLRQGYHNTPTLLNKLLQDNIDAIDKGDDVYSCQTVDESASIKDFDAILLGYGLCSNAIVGLRSKKHRLVIPKAHDCITFFLGSKERYKQYFDKNSGGIYWYTPGWIENSLMPGEERVDYLRNIYIEKYGEDNADYLMEMEQNWLKEYNLCTYIRWPELSEQTDEYLDYTKQCADYLKWNTDILDGDKSLLQRFIDGDWNSEDFLVVEPGMEITQSFDERVLTAK